MRWKFAALILVFGIINVDITSLKWSLISVFLFSLPLLMQLVNSKVIQVYGLWGGFFLIFQTLLSPMLIDHDFKTLIPNMDVIVNVKGGLPGISGVQAITTDSKGFRTTKNIDYNNKDSYRIFAIGGSTTEQISLDDQETWTHYVQEHLSREADLNVEVINTGVSGLRAINHLATLKKIIGMNPDMVIFLIGINDWNRHILEVLSPQDETIKKDTYWTRLLFRKTLLGKTIKLAGNYATSSTGETNKPSERDEYGEYYSEQRDSLSRTIKKSFSTKEVRQEYKKELTDISEICHENNIKCLFISQPSGYQKGADEEYKKGFWMTPPNQSYTLSFQNMIDVSSLYNSYLLRSSRDNGHNVCDAASKIRAGYEYFYDDCHFNTNGAKEMGKIVGQCVENLYNDVKP